MKDMRRAIKLASFFITLLVCAAGVIYVFLYITQSDRWINRAYNIRLAEAKKTTVQGAVIDRAGVVLADSFAVGERHYAFDSATRRIMSHTTGDQANMSLTGVENFHASTLLGFSATKTDYTLKKITGGDPEGNDIQLTASATLSASIAQSFPSGKNGAAVVINYKTGEILAMVSMPNFDPANMSAEVADTAYYNRVLQTRYAPGSCFKIVTLAAALNALEGVENDAFSCSGSWNYLDTHTMSCAEGATHGDMTLLNAFTKSCNITFGKLSYRIGASAMRETAEAFGFNYEFSFQDVILNESYCLNSGADAGELIQAGIGQGTTLVTPLHMAMIAGAIGNKGVMMEPKLILRVISPSGSVISEMSARAFTTVASEQVAETIASYMYEAVRNGTGSRAKISGYTDGYVCGKTGSAEWSSDKSQPTHAWFTGFLYGDDAHPYAVAVVIEKGGYGGDLAATLAGKALKAAIQLDI